MAFRLYMAPKLAATIPQTPRAAKQSTACCRLEPALGSAEAGVGIQFERLGYFCVDADDTTPDRPVFNRIVTLRDTWAKLQKQKQKQKQPRR